MAHCAPYAAHILTLAENDCLAPWPSPTIDALARDLDASLAIALFVDAIVHAGLLVPIQRFPERRHATAEHLVALSDVGAALLLGGNMVGLLLRFGEEYVRLLRLAATGLVPVLGIGTLLQIGAHRRSSRQLLPLKRLALLLFDHLMPPLSLFAAPLLEVDEMRLYAASLFRWVASVKGIAETAAWRVVA